MTDTLYSTNKLFELESKLEAREAELRDIAMMGTVITSIHEIQSVLSVVMDMAVRLVNGEVGIILLEEGGLLQPRASWGISGELARSLMTADGQELPTYCYSQQKTIVMSELGYTPAEGVSIEEIIAVPIKTSTKCYGVALIINKSDRSTFTSRDQESLETLLNFVAVAIHNSLLMQERLEKQKMEQEIAVARLIQETILPERLLKIPGVEIGAMFYPAREVSGDFYELVKINDSEFVVIIGDVTNKGIPAAMLMSAASGIIKTILAEKPEIEMSELAGLLNKILAEQIIKDREMFITIFFARFNLAKKEITYCNAGHLPGLFWDHQKQSIAELSEGGTLVGQFGEFTFQQGSRPLGKGDRLFLFTDGLTEAENAEGELFGRERAKQVFAEESNLPPNQFCARVKEWVDKYAVGSSEESHDDFTILQVKI
ncbi:MAG: SpoIIE family protein phosphatase [bacterium]|nr:SpoIIE family protein phosphatase [bacterium]